MATLVSRYSERRKKLRKGERKKEMKKKKKKNKQKKKKEKSTQNKNKTIPTVTVSAFYVLMEAIVMATAAATFGEFPRV